MNPARLKSKSFVLPTVMFAVFVLTFLTLLQSGPTKYDSLIRTLIQWDGRLYLSIASEGYELYPCGDDSGHLCGNVGWFPMYPLAAGLLTRIGLDYRYSLLAVTWLSLWLALLALYRLVARRFGDRTALVSLICLLLFPGSLYLLTGFPYAFYLMLLSIAFYMLDTENYRWLPLPSAMLAVTYPSGIVIGLPVLWVLVSRYKKLGSVNRKYLFMTLAAMGAALSAFCLNF